MEVLAVFGKYIAESWGPDIFNECHIIEKGYLKSFISKKRSNRAHHLLALAREVLYFQSFLESNETTDTSDIFEEEIFNFQNNKSCDLNLSKEICEILKQKEKYQKKTKIGIHVNP